MHKIVSACTSILKDCPNAEKARNYLNKRISQETQDKFECGYFPPTSEIDDLLSFIDIDELINNELLIQNEGTKDITYSPLSNHNLIIPYKDVYGKIIALVGRNLLEEDERKEAGISKYKNTSFKKSKHLFALYEAKHAIIENGFVYLVEGQFDAIKAHEAGICNVVAIGSSNLSFDQFALLLRYTNNIKLLLDNDEAGLSGRKKIMEKFGKYANIENMFIPNGFKDVDELISNLKIEDSKSFKKAMIS